VSERGLQGRSWGQEGARRAPFAPSNDYSGVRATGWHSSYTTADTWYPTWGPDDLLYTPFTDGGVGGVTSLSYGEAPTVGHATIRGHDPLDLAIEGVGLIPVDKGAYQGRYPCGSLMVDGVWYYGSYTIADGGRGLNYDVLGPLVGFHISTDAGASWTAPKHTPSAPLFGESGWEGDPVRMGTPHFVDFGKNMEHSPDGYAYLVGHGSLDSRDQLSWISGDAVFLARCKPSPETMNDPGAWQFFTGRDDDGAARWEQHVGAAQPIASWTGHMGCATVTFVPATGKYIMCVTDGWPTIRTMDSYLLEADDVTGPWKMIAHLPEFGPQGYFLNFPSKFISEDGQRAWLCYSANFTSSAVLPLQADPVGSRYAMCLLELEFVTTKEDPDFGRHR
jgi:hypothetical protein